jgi:tRNA(Glu) U13 pseudouridine synthase TruD
MEVNEIYQKLIEDASERAAQSKAQAEKDQAALDMVQELPKLAEEKLQSFGKERYDVGFADGKASIVLPEPGDEKIYSQTEVNEIVNKVEAKKDEDAKFAMDEKQKEFDAETEELKKQVAEADGVKAERDQLLEASKSDKEEMEALKADVNARIDAATEIVAK